jgi:hypothetical protein
MCWIEELTSRAYTNWKKSGMNLPDIAQNANTREKNNLFKGYGGCCVVGIGDDKLEVGRTELAVGVEKGQ